MNAPIQIHKPKRRNSLLTYWPVYVVLIGAAVALMFAKGVL